MVVLAESIRVVYATGLWHLCLNTSPTTGEILAFTDLGELVEFIRQHVVNVSSMQLLTS